MSVEKQKYVTIETALIRASRECESEHDSEKDVTIGALSSKLVDASTRCVTEMGEFNLNKIIDELAALPEEERSYIGLTQVAASVHQLASEQVCGDCSNLDCTFRRQN